MNLNINYINTYNGWDGISIEGTSEVMSEGDIFGHNFADMSIPVPESICQLSQHNPRTMVRAKLKKLQEQIESCKKMKPWR